LILSTGGAYFLKKKRGKRGRGRGMSEAKTRWRLETVFRKRGKKGETKEEGDLFGPNSMRHNFLHNNVLRRKKKEGERRKGASATQRRSPIKGKEKGRGKGSIRHINAAVPLCFCFSSFNQWGRRGREKKKEGGHILLGNP